MTDSASELRHRLGAARQAIPTQAQDEASTRILGLTQPWFHTLHPGMVAAYLATDGEPDVAAIVALVRGLGWQIAYPRIAGDRMTFHVVDNETQLVEGRWGLMEPPSELDLIAPEDLQVALVPLVGFDRQCNRIGRGKGFYDTAFGFLRDRPGPRHPFLIGVAHEVQQLDKIVVAPHDVRLDAVVTSTAVHGSLPRYQGPSGPLRSSKSGE